MKYLNGQSESYTLSARKKSIKKKMMYVHVQVIVLHEDLITSKRKTSFVAFTTVEQGESDDREEFLHVLKKEEEKVS